MLNVDRLLNIKQLDKEIADVESLAAEQEAITRETNPDVLFDEAKNTTELASLIDMYGRLTYESKEIDKAIEEQGANYRLDRQKEKNNKQKELIEIQDRIDANSRNKRVLIPLQSMFLREKANLDQLLSQLYNLGADDSLIPSIKELYETP